MANFDPNAAASADSGIFGLPYSFEESKLIYMPVPWEATTSYGGGTSQGPGAILEASRQVDLYDADVIKPYEAGVYLLGERSEIRAWNEEAKALARKIIEVGGEIEGDPVLERALERVNELSAKVNSVVYDETKRILASGKIAALVGGDHSSPFGAFKAAAEHHPGLGILHFDAHLDLRIAYEGFTWSHASIMYNAMERIPGIAKLVQVGIRDFCEQEAEFARANPGRICVYSDRDLSRRKHEGESWWKIAQDVVSKLPREVFVSFDIDGLDPRFCPHTGTPVPGGLDFQEANSILRALVLSGRKIVGFDLNEVAPGPDGDEWDANVGARLLYKMTGWTLVSQGLAKAAP